jgi:septal ring factor EnvC (AmiA/AmiB activator)
MKNYIKPVIFGVVILVLAIFILERSCPRSDTKYQKLKGELTEARKDLKESKAALVEKNKATDENTEELEKEVKELKQEVKKLDGEILESKKRDEEKAQAIYDLREEGETLTDPVDIIANKNLLLKVWEERFWNERKEKEKIIKQRNFWASIAFKQFKKYQNEHSIRLGLDKQLSAEEAYDDIAERTVKEGDKVIRRAGLKLNLKNVLYSGAFFGLGYLLGAAT